MEAPLAVSPSNMATVSNKQQSVPIMQMLDSSTNWESSDRGYLKRLLDQHG